MSLKCDAVFEGGGVRGIGHIGAAFVIENAGYSFQNLAGSSAGAIVAALLAVGYTTEEIKYEMETLDYSKFKQDGFFSRFGAIGKFLSIYKSFGVYSADWFENWMTGLLTRKGKLRFGDIRDDSATDEKYLYKLQVTASDITDKRLLTLPLDLRRFGINPDSFLIAKAVRMSMSIPIFYQPFHLKDSDGNDHLIVDGGFLSNYPIWLLDDPSKNPPYPTFGFKFIDPDENTCKGANCVEHPQIVDYLKQMVATSLDGHDNQYISRSKGDFDRTIPIPVVVTQHGREKKISSTDFDISKSESKLLFDNGVNAATDFLALWDFEYWKRRYRVK